MGMKGMLIRSSLPLLIRLNTMRTGSGPSLLTPKVRKGVQPDPADPRTWWMAGASAAQNPIPVMAQMYDHAMFLAGVPAQKFYSDAKTHIAAIAAVSAYYGLDAATGGGDTYNYEAEALGQKMIHSEHAMPDIDSREPLIREPGDLKKIKVPDWERAARIPFILEIIRMNAEMGFATGKFSAPFSLAVSLRTYPKLIRDLRKDPGFAHDLFSFLVDEVLTSYLKVQKKYCGIKAATGADAWAVFPNLTPDLTEQWVVPYAERLFKKCTDFGLITMAAGGGGDYCEERVEKFDKQILHRCFAIQQKLLLNTPMLILGMGRWHEYPLEPVAEYLQKYRDKGIRASIMANLNARLLRDGPPERIIAAVKRFIKVLGRAHNLAIVLANIPADTPPRHIHAAVAATRACGRLAPGADPDEIEVTVPERESLQEYIDTMSGGRGLPVS